MLTTPSREMGAPPPRARWGSGWWDCLVTQSTRSPRRQVWQAKAYDPEGLFGDRQDGKISTTGGDARGREAILKWIWLAVQRAGKVRCPNRRLMPSHSPVGGRMGSRVSRCPCRCGSLVDGSLVVVAYSTICCSVLNPLPCSSLQPSLMQRMNDCFGL
ncbi:hypothetical protein LY78DRAFT_473156 [Colletotrichum sublineola]|nr:hypothetical protein LY78DRAFT_473156 [Colletotrichum sublineola]